jgi:precorrin-6x reductase
VPRDAVDPSGSMARGCRVWFSGGAKHKLLPRDWMYRLAGKALDSYRAEGDAHLILDTSHPFATPALQIAEPAYQLCGRNV